MKDIEEKRTELIYFIRNTIYKATGAVTGLILLVILGIQFNTDFKYTELAALVTMIAAWVIVFVCEYYVFLIKNFSGHVIERLYNHVKTYMPQ